MFQPKRMSRYLDIVQKTRQTIQTLRRYLQTSNWFRHLDKQSRWLNRQYRHQDNLGNQIGCLDTHTDCLDTQTDEIPAHQNRQIWTMCQSVHVTRRMVWTGHSEMHLSLKHDGKKKNGLAGILSVSPLHAVQMKCFSLIVVLHNNWVFSATN